MRPFDSYSGYCFDLDGCLYRGTEAVPGAQDLLEHLRNLNKKVSFISNNSNQSAPEVVHRLQTMGIAAHPDEVWVPTDAVGEFLMESFGLVSVYALGSEAVVAALVTSGLTVVDPKAPRCDIVLVARDLGFSFEKLQAASRFVQGGARLVAANPDSYHPGAGGLRVPETGALVAAIVEVTGQPALTLGKPGPYLFQRALEQMNLDPSAVVMVGDNLDTDIAGAQNLGLDSVWINAEGHSPPGTPVRVCSHLQELWFEVQNKGGGQP